MAYAKWDVAAQEHAESLERLALQHKVELAEIRKQHASLQQVQSRLRIAVASDARRTTRSKWRGGMPRARDAGQHARAQESEKAQQEVHAKARNAHELDKLQLVAASESKQRLAVRRPFLSHCAVSHFRVLA